MGNSNIFKQQIIILKMKKSSASSLFSLSGRRGQGLGINAVVLIVIGIIVLGILAAGFILGWGNLSALFSGGNIQGVVTSCNLACETLSVYDFCTLPRELKTSDENDGNKVTCDDLATFKGLINIDGETLPDYNGYGVSSCSGVQSNSACDAKLQIAGSESVSEE